MITHGIIKRPKWRLKMQPKPKTQEAYEYLKNYQGLTNPNKIEFRRWLKDGEKLVATSPVDGYILQGFAHDLLGNAILALDSMKKAKMLNNYFGKVNYASLLTRFGKYEESTQICLALLQQNPMDKHVFLMVLDNADFALDAELAKTAFSLYKGNDMDLQPFLSSLNKKTQILQEININKEIFINIKKRLFNFLSYHYCGDFVTKPLIVENEIGKRIDLNVYLNNVDVYQCVELTEMFMDKLIDDDTLHFDEYKNIIVHFIPARYNQVA